MKYKINKNKVEFKNQQEAHFIYKTINFAGIEYDYNTTIIFQNIPSEKELDKEIKRVEKYLGQWIKENY